MAQQACVFGSLIKPNPYFDLHTQMNRAYSISSCSLSTLVSESDVAIIPEGIATIANPLSSDNIRLAVLR